MSRRMGIQLLSSYSEVFLNYMIPSNGNFRFESTIVAQFFGHDHLDYFTVFYEDMHDITSKPIGVSLFSQDSFH